MAHHVLTPRQLQTAEKHRHQRLGYSLLDPLIYKFASLFLPYIPAWLSPNVITVAAHIMGPPVLILLLIYSPNSCEEIPHWLIILHSAFLLIWIILDTLDGQHARRLNQSSLLGKLLDENLDAISFHVGLAGTGYMLKIGTIPYMSFWFFILSDLNSASDYLRAISLGGHSPGKMDLTEFVIIQIIIATLLYIYGDQFIFYKVPLVGTVQNALALSLTLLSIQQLCSTLQSILFLKGKSDEGNEVGKSLRNIFLSIALILLCGLYVSGFSSFKNDKTLMHYTAFAFSPLLIKLGWETMLVNVTRERNEKMDFVLLCPLALVLLDFLRLPFDVHYAVYSCMILGWVNLVIFKTQLILDVKEYFNESLFTLNNNKKGKD